eukprot:TRINITY_DN5410_c1_g1_i5.p1 TRINITY_DN5410_c1_g1~~TRINITY_DN5410_c1_g1_i5.p1  ORF type:complete len:141 (-),score=5.50 TRINITY_DN5410_c1_g1_i5:359-781(-)
MGTLSTMNTIVVITSIYIFLCSVHACISQQHRPALACSHPSAQPSLSHSLSNTTNTAPRLSTIYYDGYQQVTGEDKTADVLVDMVHQAKDQAGIPQSTPLAALGMTLAGMDYEETQEKLRGLLLARDEYVYINTYIYIYI